MEVVQYVIIKDQDFVGRRDSEHLRVFSIDPTSVRDLGTHITWASKNGLHIDMASFEL